MNLSPRSFYSRLGVIALVAVTALLGTARDVQGQGAFNVLTRNYNNQRTGANLSEAILNTSNVNPSQFGKLYMLPVDDQVYAGILYVSNVAIAGRTHNVIYVATVNNTVYAFDADTLSSPLWVKNFNGSGRPTRNSEVGQACGTYRDYTGNGNLGSSANIGIVGTPVIDGASKTMYFVGRTVENTATVQRLHAIDITNGNERANSPQVIQATSGGLAFNPTIQNQRPALAFSQGTVYVGWASFCDTGSYHGWLIAYDAATLAQSGVFNSTPNGARGGIWMSGAAPAFDAAGNLYVSTGNGSFDGTTQFGESLIKMTPAPSFSSVDFFTPSTYQTLENNDWDFGSQGPVLLPGTNKAVIGGKEGKMYIVDTTNLGHRAAGDTQIPQVITVSDLSPRPGMGFTHHMHNASPVWQSPQGLNVYVWPENDYLHGFRFDTATQKFTVDPVTNAAKPFANGLVLPPIGMPGGMMTLSANGSQAGSGILWVTIPRAGDANQDTVPGVLYAFNAETLGTPLWTSLGAGNDTLNFAKGAPPLVANGKVYAASISNFVSVYGPKASGQIVQNLALNRPASSSTPCDPTQTADKAFNGSTSGGPADKWCSSVPNPFLQVDLGANFSVSRFVVEHGGAGGEDGNNTRDFLIQVSVDGANFDTIVNASANSYSITTHDVTPIVARFVRLAVLAPLPASIYEFQVYGVPAPSTPDFQLSAAPNSQALVVGGATSYTANIVSLNGFAGSAALAVTGLPSGAKGSFSPASINGSGPSTLNISTSTLAQPGIFPLTITATSGALSHSTVVFLTVNRVNAGSVIVNLAPVANTPAIYTDGKTFDGNDPLSNGFDGGSGNAYSANLLGSGLSVTGIPFTFGAPNVFDAVSSATVPLPAGRFGTLALLAAAFNGNDAGAPFTVTYTDGTSDVLVQSVSDWFSPQNFPGETVAAAMSYRNVWDGTRDTRPFNLYAYFLSLNSNKTVSSLILPDPRIVVLAATLVPTGSTAPDYFLSASPSSLSLTPGSSEKVSISISRVNGFAGDVALSVSDLPRGVKASFNGDDEGSIRRLRIAVDSTAHVGNFVITVTGRGEFEGEGGDGEDGRDVRFSLIRTTHVALAIREEAASFLPVDLSSSYIRFGIYTDGSVFSTGGFDGGGLAYSATLLGSSLTFGGVPFQFGPPNVADVVESAGQNVPLPSGKFASLQMIAASVNGSQENQTLKVNYTDGTSDAFTQSFSDWTPSNPPFPGESLAKTVGPRNISDGSKGRRISKIFAYAFPLNNAKRVSSVTLPADTNVNVLALTLVPPGCLYALNATAANAMVFNGPFDVNADCGVAVNSNSASALNLTGTGKLTAENIQVVGKTVKSAAVTTTPTPVDGSLAQPDPFRLLAPPAASARCDYINLTVNRGEERNLRPGTYCNGIKIVGGREGVEVNFEPGTYILMGGGLSIIGPARLKGIGVTFFLTAGLGYAYGPVTTEAATIATLKAPTNGPMEGILFFQNPAVGSGQPPSVITGSSASEIEGVLYFPTTALTYSVPGPGGDYLILVADTLTITGKIVVNTDFSELGHGSPADRRDR